MKVQETKDWVRFYWPDGMVCWMWLNKSKIKEGIEGGISSLPTTSKFMGRTEQEIYKELPYPDFIN